MRSRVHRFLLMLLMLALPLQTFAAASMLTCTLGHAPAMGNVEKASAMEMTIAVEMTVAQSATACHEPEQSDTPGTEHSCQHCAACAAASALPLPVAAAAASLPALQRFALQPAERFSAVDPDGPERPPRPFLA